jgi:hypothetical protein
MLKLEVTKTIEARTLNKRTRQMLAQPPVTLPYGAILSDVVENRDVMEFSYLGELYNCKSEVLRAASHSLDDSASSPAGVAPAATLAPASPEAQITFRWEKLNAGTIPTFRAKVPAGWLILVGDTSSRGVTFYPDVDHEWDGTTS